MGVGSVYEALLSENPLPPSHTAEHDFQSNPAKYTSPTIATMVTRGKENFEDIGTVQQVGHLPSMLSLSLDPQYSIWSHDLL